MPSTIENIFSGVISGIGTILDNLNPLSDNFILKRVLNLLSSILNYLNPFSDDFIGKKIIELLGNLLRTLFIPSDNYFINKFESLKTALYNRLSIDSYFDLLDNINGLASEEEVSIDLDCLEVGGESYSMNGFIDFSFISRYKSTYYGFVRGFFFIFYVFYIINCIYRLIRGSSLISLGRGSGDVDRRW